MSKVGDWFFEKFLNILLSGSSMILNTLAFGIPVIPTRLLFALNLGALYPQRMVSSITWKAKRI